MNYTIYLNREKNEVTFNYIYTVGDLQAIILEKFKLKRQNVLSIIHDNKILGRDYTFDESLIRLNLFDITLHVIIDPEDESTGTKIIFYDWLVSKYRPEQLSEAHRQIMFSNILNNTWSNTAVNFMTERNRGQSRNRTRSRQNSNQMLDPNLTNQRSSTNRQPPSTNRQPPSTTSRAPSTTSRAPSTTSRAPSTTSRGPSSRPSSSFSFASTMSNPGSRSGSGTQTTDDQINQGVQDIFSAFMGMPLSSSSSSTSTTNSTTNLLNSILSLADGGEISFSTTTIPLGEGQNFWDILDNLQSVPVTLSQDLLDSLPTFKYNEIPSDIKGSDEESQDVCTICMGNYETEDEVRVLLCKHYYHKECIDRWLSQENTRCPVCRHDNRDPHTSQSASTSIPSRTAVRRESTNDLQDEMD